MFESKKHLPPPATPLTLANFFLRQRSMKLLCIDVGNTSTHYGLVEGEHVSATGEAPTDWLREGPATAFADQVSAALAQADGIAFWLSCAGRERSVGGRHSIAPGGHSFI
jgi:hypothetical protein